jgi:hypothetical protein
VAGIGISLLVGQSVSIHDFCGPTSEKWSNDRVSVRIVVTHDFIERTLEQIPNRNALADVQISISVDVYAFRMTQILPWTFSKLPPGLWLDP